MRRSVGTRRVRRVAALAALFLFAVVGASAANAAPQTTVSVEGDRFLINGSVTHPGSPAEGLLLNSRMVQATFDDENVFTVGNWAYPDLGRWDADRNASEFVAALPSYAAKGLRAVT
ncbi:MAG TPA: hypothetical protein VGU26_09725, partial [Gaiellaceae bacterium]|nr:hypothetical protein [Gaiellaceae bacterium]